MQMDKSFGTIQVTVPAPCGSNEQAEYSTEIIMSQLTPKLIHRYRVQMALALCVQI